MKKIIITALTLIIVTLTALASKKAPKIEEAFNSLKRGDNGIVLKDDDKANSLVSLIKVEGHSIVQALYVLQEIKNSNMKADLTNLSKLLKIHEAKTFKSRYPEHWRFIKAKDYESRLCREIEAVIKLKKEEKHDAE